MRFLGPSAELLRFLALLRKEIERGGSPSETVTRADLHEMIDLAVHRFLKGEEP